MTDINVQVAIRKYKNAIVVTGETKSIKDNLKSIGGKWNSKLTGDDGEVFGGWVFPVTKHADIKTLLNELEMFTLDTTGIVPEKDTPSKLKSMTIAQLHQMILDLSSRVEALEKKNAK